MVLSALISDISKYEREGEPGWGRPYRPGSFRTEVLPDSQPCVLRGSEE